MDITSLLELKQTVKILYIRHEMIIRYALRFLLALVAIGMINGRLGYYEQFSGIIVTIALSLVCAVLPTGFTAVICALLILLHLYALSLEACVIAAIIFLCAYLLYYRFSTHDAVILLLTPVLFTLHIPHVMVFVLGLLFMPYSVISLVFGIGIWFYLHNIVLNVTQYANAQGGAEEHLSRVQDIAGSMAGDRTMLVYMAAFAVSAVLIYTLRRQSIDRAWFIAIAAGAFANLVILFVGDVALDASVGIPGALLGTVLGILTGIVIMFFVFNVDYSRVEKVQFEDEEYYYYVKAVPKIALQERARHSKNINRSLESAEDTAQVHTAHAKQQHPARHKTNNAQGHKPKHASAQQKEKNSEKKTVNR